MAIKSGLAAQFGMKAESIWGTPVTVDRFYYFDSDTVKPNIQKVRLRGLGSGVFDRTAHQVTNVFGYAGTTQHTVFDKSFGLLLKACMGAAAIEQVGSTTEYKQTFTPHATGHQGSHYTVQIGTPGTDGTVRTRTYDGGKVTGWELKSGENEPVTLIVSWFFRDCVTNTALASASYASGWTPYVFSDCAWTIGGSGVYVKSWSIKGDNGLTVDRRGLAQVKSLEPVQTGPNRYTASLEMESFVDLTHYAAMLAGTQQGAVLTITGDTIPAESNPFKLVATFAAMDIEGEGVSVPGEGIVPEKLNLMGLYNGTDPVLKLEYHSTDTAA
jgi:hypothetical protein